LPIFLTKIPKKMKTKLFIFGLASVLSLNSCRKTPKETVKEEKTVVKEHVKEEKHHNKHWSYEGETAPEHWSSISDKNLACAGNAQSPINIQDAKKAAKENKLAINYKSSDLRIVNNGHTEEFVISDGNTLSFNGKEYKLKQFHMHTLSEHTVNGEHFPLEIHFVNKAADGTFAVISILYKEGEKSAFLDKYLGNFPTEKGKEYKEEGKLDILSVLPKTDHYYHYKGSFTTPPCTEVVEWVVLKESPTASKEQLEKLHQLMGDNYRPTQALNDRVIEIQ